MKATWGDWWASRTIRFNAYFMALWTAALPVILMLDEADWQVIGLSERSALILVAVLQIINAANIGLRTITTHPLEGRRAR